jgi:hypothetical protein
LNYIIPPFDSFICMLLQLQLIWASHLMISSASEESKGCQNRFSFCFCRKQAGVNQLH